jgi:MscS family membrane protein
MHKWLLTAIICGLAGAAFGQNLPTGTAQATIPRPAPEAWDSPQATVQTFVDDMQASNIDDARRALDLSDVPFPVRDIRGNQYAALLASVLSRVHNFKIESLPITTIQLTQTIPVTLKDGNEVGKLVLDKSRTGFWRFNSQTVSTLPHLFKIVADEPQDNGIPPFKDPPADNAMNVRASMPGSLLHSFLFFEIWQWLGVALMILAGMVFAFLVRVGVRIVIKIFFRRLELTEFTKWSLRRSAGFLGATCLWWSVYDYLGFEGTSFLILIVILKACLFTAIAWIADAFFDLLLDSFRARATTLVRRADDILIPIAKKFVRFLFIIFAILTFAASMSVNITGLMTGLGIGGLVLALAGKDSVENIFGSLTIIFDMPFGLGDYIKMTGAEGTIEEINLRSTRIRTAQDTLITMPNSNLIKAYVENFGARRARRFSTTLPISYVSDFGELKKFCDRARKVVKGIDKVRTEDAYVDLTTLDSGSIGLNIQIFFTTDEYAEELRLREETIHALLAAASDAKVILGAANWDAPIPSIGEPAKPTTKNS